MCSVGKNSIAPASSYRLTFTTLRRNPNPPRMTLNVA